MYKGCEYTGGVGFGYVNAMDGCGKGEELCHVDGTNETGATHPGTTPPFCDYIAYDDARRKLQYAHDQLKAPNNTYKGFFLAVGIRRPHLTWRVPAPYAAMYDPATTALPSEPTLDKSIDPIAWTSMKALGGNDPFNRSVSHLVSGLIGLLVRTNTDMQVKTYRAAYYAAVSWGDYVAGKVLDKLTELGLDDTTAVVMHSDHGW